MPDTPWQPTTTARRPPVWRGRGPGDSYRAGLRAGCVDYHHKSLQQYGRLNLNNEQSVLEGTLKGLPVGGKRICIHDSLRGVCGFQGLTGQDCQFLHETPRMLANRIFLFLDEKTQPPHQPINHARSRDGECGLSKGGVKSGGEAQLLGE